VSGGGLPDGVADAVVFDCDGTLVDTESISDESHRVVLRRRGYEVTDEDLQAIIGRPNHEVLDHWDARVPGGVGDRDAFAEEDRVEFRRLFDAGVEVHRDAVDAVLALHAAGVPVGVCSSSRRAHVERVLEVCGLTDVVRVVVGAEDTSEHKPTAAPYLEAARRLGVDASRCAAVEDTGVGVAAARAAGMWTVAVVRGHVPRESLAAADVVTERLETHHLVPSR
jgi:HAD superfamily hydrolase (TIGR01509 family)